MKIRNESSRKKKGKKNIEMKVREKSNRKKIRKERKENKK